MEIEKALYKIHERTLAISCCRGFMLVIFVIFLLLTLLFGSLFIFANVKYKDKNDVLKPIYDSLLKNNNNTEYPEEMLFNIIIADFETNKSNTSQIIMNSVHVNLLVCGNLEILYLKKEIKNKYNVSMIKILIPPEKFYSNDFEKFVLKEIITYESVLINQIINTYEKIDIHIRNVNSEEDWTFTKNNLEAIQWSKDPLKAFFLRLLGVIRIIFGLFLVSSTTALYILITIISAPIFILCLFECCIRLGNQNLEARLTFYKAFPWIGIYLYALNYNNKKQTGLVFLAFLFMIIIFYIMYISCLVIWNSLLFGNTYKLGADQNFYGYIIFLEITSLFFIRTRTSLKFYPSLIFFSLFMYLFYINFNGYAFYSVAFLTLVFLTMTFFSLILAFVEVPAVNWNPSFHYAPSINKPRSLYFPMFSLSWYYDLPAIWTLFFPLHDRSTFTNAEMSMVDRNYVLLNQTLEQANNQQNQQGPEGQNQNMEPPQIFVPNAPANPNNNL